jgi:hypothetical protein
MIYFVNLLIVWIIEQYIIKTNEIKIFYFMSDDMYKYTTYVI